MHKRGGMGAKSVHRSPYRTVHTGVSWEGEKIIFYWKRRGKLLFGTKHRPPPAEGETEVSSGGIQ
jgi:hypothetical protein